MTDITTLRALAAAATPGPWHQHSVDETQIDATDGTQIAGVCGDYDSDDQWPIMAGNAAYIAAASPAAMLPLINALIEWRDAIKAYDGAFGDDDDAGKQITQELRINRAEAALLALISGKPTQETTP